VKIHALPDALQRFLFMSLDGGLQARCHAA
jgi:hypothetical protein